MFFYLPRSQRIPMFTGDIYSRSNIDGLYITYMKMNARAYKFQGF